MEEKISRGISYLFHPLLIPTYIILILLNSDVFYSRLLPSSYLWLLTGVVFLTTFLLPAVLTWFLFRLGLISSFFMTAREERIFPVISIAIFYYITYHLLRGNHITPVFAKYMLGAAILAMIAMIVNLFRKISLHMISAGSIAGLFIGLAIRYGVDFRAEIAAAILLAGLIGFARMRSGSHTPVEIYSGFFSGSAVMTGVMILF